jgi:hypothetical protein
MFEGQARLDPDDRAAREELRRPTAQRAELHATGLVVARLVEHVLAERGHLVAPDDDGAGVFLSHGPGLRERQSYGPRTRRFAGPSCFVDSGADYVERRRDPLEQGAAVAGSRGEDEGRHSSSNSATRNNGLAGNPL